jgi:hypothetical protein
LAASTENCKTRRKAIQETEYRSKIKAHSARFCSWQWNDETNACGVGIDGFFDQKVWISAAGKTAGFSRPQA